ncbi:cyclic nucleotide-binding domain-containing protein 2-like [Plakobranchus ocellatus]|uniref:Cyclic nucleotide-binding domain-containing protein 2-like n=1 Tax=Plakobranchus ocellatus TaxID=259542 RepID=A0AAV3ZMI5_9GAST|nr:cyclic nucleotide-binding domain-containing protein 2-like [Plakobranchus ocellatus]
MRKKVKGRKIGFNLKTWSKLAILCIRLCKQSVENLARPRGQYQSVMQVLDEYGAKISFRGLVFSRKDFRVTDQHSLSRGARQLLKQEPSTRTERDINVMLVALKHIPAFAEYPRKMQWRLCQVGRFEAYEPRRVVLREGDVPTSFYFILSGTVIVTAYEEATQTSRTLVSLTKGMSFGELAVISNTRRQGTVCTRTDVQLLSISGQEFKEIFMAGGRDILASEKQRDFIRGVSFLRHWPIERLREDPRSCTVYYFDRNQVLVRDSNNSDWIYLVLKGSLSVIKKLKRVDPQLSSNISRKRKREIPDSTSTSRSFQRHNQDGQPSRLSALTLDTHHCEESRLSLFLHTSQDTFKTPYELDFKLEQTLPGYRNEKDRIGCLNYEQIINSYRSRLICKDVQPHGKGLNLNGTIPIISQPALGASGNETMEESRQLTLETAGESVLTLPDINHNNKTVQNHLAGRKNSSTKAKSSKIDKSESINGFANTEKEEYDGDGEESIVTTTDDVQEAAEKCKNNVRPKRKMKLVRKTTKGVYLAPSETAVQTERQDGNQSNIIHPLSLELDADKQEPEYHQSMPGSQSDLQKEETIEAKLARLQIQYQRRVIDREGRKTIAEELDYKARRDYKFTEADLDPTVIEVQVLERGQYFGLAPILFPDQSSLSVISNGAECLVISKKLFLQWATEECLRFLRQTESPYPSERELNRKLQEVVNWQANRAVVYQNLASQIAQRKARRKQFLPNFQGQYCFRTGPA